MSARHYDTRAQALADGCAKVVKVEGGYLGFATLADYHTWRAQR